MTKISRCCLITSIFAMVLVAVALWQFYRHIDLGITLAYAANVSDERREVIDQLRELALGELRGKSRDGIIRLVEGQGRTWFAKDDKFIVAESLVFELDGQGLADIYSAFEEPAR